MIPSTHRRVLNHTAAHLNQKIRRRTDARVEANAKSSHDAIVRRLVELDREWDIERVLEANAATVGLIGIAMSAANRRWLFLPAAVLGFLLQHAFQGWCPPLAVFRRFGVRTASEIEEERTALKALRGDFRRVESDGRKRDRAAARRALAAARK